MKLKQEPVFYHGSVIGELDVILGQFTRNYTQTTKRGLLTTNKG